MKRFHAPYLIACLLVAAPVVAPAAQASGGLPPQSADSIDTLPADEQAAHRELIAFRVGIQNAFNKLGESGKVEDMRALLEYAHPDILFTAMTGESLRGKEALMAYFNRDFVAPDHSLTRMHSEFTADHLSILLRPDVATNRGRARGSFTFSDGSQLTVDTRWTATLVREAGVWKLATFHFSPSIFDNPVVSAYRAWIYKAAIIAGVAAC